jgi:hypothetical protein
MEAVHLPLIYSATLTTDAVSFWDSEAQGVFHWSEHG